ncbi:MAG: GspH/FimT family pseudopilin [Gammaproteobacteria bacterium]
MEGGSLRGFTLIELLVTIALLAIFSLIAVPAYRNFIAANRAATELNTFVAHLQYARIAAMQNGTNVSMCVSEDGVSCKGAGNWNEGWMIFVDRDNDRTLDDGEALLRVHAALPGGDRLVGNSNIDDAITFNRFGIPAGVYTGTVVLHANPDRTSALRCIKISRVGKVRALRGDDCCEPKKKCK